MRWLKLSDILKVLSEKYDFQDTENNNPGVFALKSPTTGLSVPFPMGQGDSLPDNMVRHILGDEEIDFDEFLEELAKLEEGDSGSSQ